MPTTILASVRQAEHRYYSNSSALRWAVEEAQDILAFASPELAYRANFSLGRYRIKAQTIEDLLPWAVEQEYVSLENTTLTSFAHALAYFAEQPVLSDWQAAIYLAWLKEEHPQMRDLAWAKIAADPFLIAKLYSGYMGAGGAWETWRESLTPGPVAKRRLGLQ